MNISSLKSNKILVNQFKNEEINFLTATKDNLIISKTRIRENDFNGIQIQNPDYHIRTKSIWMINTQNEEITEAIPYGDFDINDTYATETFLYFLKIIDEDHDGLLLERDYSKGEIWRLHRSSLQQDFCFRVEPYNFHRFLSANDSYIVFVSEDRIPDTTEIVFFNITTHQFAVLNNIYKSDWHDYRIVNNDNGEPEFLIIKQENDEHSNSQFSPVKLILWPELLSQLEWK